MQPSPIDPDLARCLERLKEGPWSFIQLRGEALQGVPADGGDIDLLGTRASVDRLLQAAFNWVQLGLCHLRIRSQNNEKVEFTLISPDGSQSIQFDLWIHLRQLDHRRRELCYSSTFPTIRGSGASILRFHIAVETCLYIHHLVSKRKDLKSERVRHRLEQYRSACALSGEQELVEILEQIQQTGQIQKSMMEWTMRFLEKELFLQDAKSPSAWRKLFGKGGSSWLAPSRKVRHLSIIGCDGAGKTTLATAVAQNHSSVQLLIGKHLYRKSLTYKAAVIFIRPFLRQSRELFDEFLAPAVYLRAAGALRWRTLFSGKQSVSLIDRSLLDFLMINRKTDFPSFSRMLGLARWMGQRIPTIHCIVRYENVVKRKQEVTPAGHAQYDREMFRELSQRVPTDYIVMNNDRSLEESSGTLKRILAGQILRGTGLIAQPESRKTAAGRAA